MDPVCHSQQRLHMYVHSYMKVVIMLYIYVATLALWYWPIVRVARNV